MARSTRSGWFSRAAVLATAVALATAAPAAGTGAAERKGRLGEGDAVFRPVDLGAIPELPLAGTLTADERAYLGLPPEGPVTIAGVRGELVVIEFFNSSCYACALMAPVMDEVWRRVDAHPELRERVRFIGIGVGNTVAQVANFHDQYDTPFPMVPDPEFAAFDALGTFEGTPYLVLLHRPPDGGEPAATAQVGHIPDAGKVVAAIEAALAGTAPDAAVGVMAQEGDGWRNLRPALSPEELAGYLARAAAGAGLAGAAATPVDLPGDAGSYYRLEAGGRHLWALLAGRAKVCNVCHDIFFIVVFDDGGKIVNLEPITITKYKNEEFDEKDIAFLRSRTVGRLLTKEIVFDPEVDGVTAATMSSALVFDTLRRLRANYAEMVKSGVVEP